VVPFLRLVFFAFALLRALAKFPPPFKSFRSHQPKLLGESDRCLQYLVVMTMSIVSRLTPALRPAAAIGFIVSGALVLAASPDPAPTSGISSAEQAPEGAPQTSVSDAAGDPQLAASNLRIQLEGNRRWCVRSVEQMWPSKPRPQGRRPLGRRRIPTISTLAYAYYIVAHPQQGPDKETAVETVEAADVASPLAGMRVEGDSIQEEYLRDTPPEEVAAVAKEENEQGEEGERGKAAAQEGEQQQEMRVGIDPHLASRPGAIVLTQSPVYHTTTRRRVNRPGQPLKVQNAWDSSRTCCSLPTFVEAALPPGRYAIQAHFDVLFGGRGWKPVQVARIEGVEVKQGEVTQVRLRVDSQGYVTVNPSGRVVEFPDAAQAQTAPAQPAPAQTAPTQPSQAAAPGT
jgi:hypothetical protein